ncbi:programmed cell death protein 2-like isoform X2 [Protopterus annectens]|nr:programmed cell death protein 2-like isoform X2 [Protopterus annectens]XP_043937860.1 programmed cell death protein 2-like isoform X2 [Protopterus annectens]XP_043937861.1 programmed cell death protein 2-like isoform X2 [Protopterus annectens]
MHYPSCDICKAVMFHIVQVYCPLTSSAYHRIINVFACARQECWGKCDSWKVLRSQYLEAKGKITQEMKSKEVAPMAASDWCDTADDWGMNEEAECTGFNADHLPELKADDPHVLVASECTYQLQGLSLSETLATTEVKSFSVASAGEGLIAAGSVPCFQSYFISVVDELDYESSVDISHAEELLKEYQQREGVAVDQLISESCVSEGNEEKYEKTFTKHGDRTFLKFMKKISACPEQILRYSWKGTPLFITTSPPAMNTLIPSCKNCGSSRVFEFQLMPALVSMLKTASNEDISVEFGTVLIYTCEKSCWTLGWQIPQEEFPYVQADPDQALFKVNT